MVAIALQCLPLIHPFEVTPSPKPRVTMEIITDTPWFPRPQVDRN
jgi:hypothetical protein